VSLALRWLSGTWLRYDSFPPDNILFLTNHTFLQQIDESRDIARSIALKTVDILEALDDAIVDPSNIPVDLLVQVLQLEM
jgi:hypothetical protein